MKAVHALAAALLLASAAGMVRAQHAHHPAPVAVQKTPAPAPAPAPARRVETTRLHPQPADVLPHAAPSAALADPHAAHAAAARSASVSSGIGVFGCSPCGAGAGIGIM